MTRLKILAYCYFPVYKDFLPGGAQYVAQLMLSTFVMRGHEVIVLCPKPRTGDLLESRPGLTIVPALKSVETRPLFPYEHWANVEWFRMLSSQTDVAWCIDYTPPIHLPIPVVLAMDQFSYPKEMHSFWTLNWTALIVSSDYLLRLVEPFASAILATKEQDWFPVIRSHLSVDIGHFTKTDSTSLANRLGLSHTDDYRNILFPHRPDPAKGFNQALAVLHRLVEIDRRFRLLIPVNPDYKMDRRYYNRLIDQVNDMRLAKHVLFHDWILHRDLPAYYSLGHCTLAIGQFPEGFGLTPVQSVACGTPAVCTRAGALRELFPPTAHGIQYVDFNDLEAMVQAVLRPTDEADLRRGRRHVEAFYNLDRQADEHLQMLERVHKDHAHQNASAQTVLAYQESPWCLFYENGTVWHDYRMHLYKLTPKEREVLVYIRNQSQVPERLGTTVTRLLERGFIVSTRLSI